MCELAIKSKKSVLKVNNVESFVYQSFYHIHQEEKNHRQIRQYEAGFIKNMKAIHLVVYAFLFAKSPSAIFVFRSKCFFVRVYFPAALAGRHI